MATKAQKVRLSIFLIISSSVLLIFFIILVGNRLLKRMNTYFIVYENISVTGLEPGAAVKFHGVQVGRVAALAVKDVTSVIVEIDVDRGTPVKKDTEATLTMVGITGLKYVELSGGSLDSEDLPVGDTIIAGQSLLEDISGRAEVIMAKLELLLNNVNEMLNPEANESIHKSLSSFASLSSELDTLFRDNRSALTNSVSNLEYVMNSLLSTSSQVDSAMTAINTFVQSQKIQDSISNINYMSGTLRAGLDSLRLEETSLEFRRLISNANKMVISYDQVIARARDDILSSLRNLEETIDNLREATDVISENPSVLIRGRTTEGDRIE